MPARRFILPGIFTVFSILYIATACPTVYTMDSGELIVAAYRLNLAHPTGYPLFCLLGKLATWLIPIGSIAWRVDVMNALLAAGAVSVLFVALSEVVSVPAALFAAALFGVSPLFWDSATSAEVHSLSILLIAAELALFLRWRRTGERKLLYCLAATAGLAMTNHLSSALILPVLLYGIWERDRTFVRDRALILKSFCLFVLPLSLYLYMPLRAAASRGTIWGDVYAVYGFIPHVTGRLYRHQMFHSPLIQVWANFVKFLMLVVKQYSPAIVLAIPFGGLMMKKRHGALFTVFSAIIALNVFYSLNYQIIDIEQYYLPTMLVLTFFAAAVVEYLLVRTAQPQSRRAVAVVLPLLLIVLAAARFPHMDKRDAFASMDYAGNVYKTLDKNALFIACGDSGYNAMMYERIVGKKRPDVVLLQRDILRTWMPGAEKWTAMRYYESIKEPSEAMRGINPADYSRQDVESEKFLNDVLDAAIKERPIYIGCTGRNYRTHPILARIDSEYRLVPEGLLYRVYPRSQKLDMAKILKRNQDLWHSYQTRGVYNGTIEGGRVEREVPLRYLAFHLALANIALDEKSFEIAAEHYGRALKINDGLTNIRNGLAIALAGQGKLQEAKKEWEKVLLEKPGDKTALMGLQMVRSACLPKP